MNNSKGIDLQIEIARYLPVKKQLKGLRILDLGCGNGFSSKLLLDWGAKSVVGIDLDIEAISFAKENYNLGNLEFIRGYAEQVAELVKLEEFDGVCFVECIEHVIDPHVVLDSLKQGLSNNAWIYITSPNDYWSYRFEERENPFHLRKYTKQEFLDATATVLGNPNQIGEAHAFLGFSMAQKTVIQSDQVISESLVTSINTRNSQNSDDSVFYFAYWGSESIDQCTIGSEASMEIYTKLFDSSKLELNVPDLSSLKIRELANKLQATSDTLVETQNQLRAIRILMDSTEISSLESSKLLPSFHRLRDLGLKRNKFSGFMQNPPNWVLVIYNQLSPRTKDSLRSIRRRILR